MSADIAPSSLNWRLLRRLRTGLPWVAADFVSPLTALLLQALAIRASSQPEFIFFQLAVTLATLSKSVVIQKGPNQALTWPNIYQQVVAAPKAGKTNCLLFFEAVRRLLMTATGFDNNVQAGTMVGVYNSTVRCARRGGLPLYAPDEAITTLISLLESQSGKNKTTNFMPEVFFSSAWSGADVARAKAAGADNMATENARLTLLAMGTLADITDFHRLCAAKYANRGLLGRFLTAFAPAYTAKCSVPVAENGEEESLLALSRASLMELLVNGLTALFRNAEAAGFDGFHLADDAIEYLDDLRTREDANQDDPEEERDWKSALTSHLLSHVEQEFRSTEMIEKWALILHVMEVLTNSFNFMERTVTGHPMNGIIALETVKAAEALVTRAQEQDAFFIQVSRITATMRNREVVYVEENIDFVLYKSLRPIIMMWPGPVVTSESFADRSFKLNLNVPYEEILAAASSLGSEGSLGRDATTRRITRPGMFKHGTVPRQYFRFYKTHPDLIESHTLDELGVSLREYTVRYNMDFYRVVDAQCLRAARTEKRFNEWLAEIPTTVLPKDETQAAVTLETARNNGQLGVYPKYGKFQQEEIGLRFGKALGKPRTTTKRKASDGDPEPQHTYRLPGTATFSNHGLPP